MVLNIHNIVDEHETTGTETKVNANNIFEIGFFDTFCKFLINSWINNYRVPGWVGFLNEN